MLQLHHLEIDAFDRPQEITALGLSYKCNGRGAVSCHQRGQLVATTDQALLDPAEAWEVVTAFFAGCAAEAARRARQARG